MVYPLEGIKVLDFSIAIAAPFGATMLADPGAEVIKVERVQGEAQRPGLPASPCAAFRAAYPGNF